MSLNVDKETLAVAGLFWGDGITIMSKLSPRKVKIYNKRQCFCMLSKF